LRRVTAGAKIFLRRSKHSVQEQWLLENSRKRVKWSKSHSEWMKTLHEWMKTHREWMKTKDERMKTLLEWT
jgi:hypothetical protein